MRAGESLGVSTASNMHNIPIQNALLAFVALKYITPRGVFNSYAWLLNRMVKPTHRGLYQLSHISHGTLELNGIAPACVVS